METLISLVFFTCFESPASQCHTQHVTLMSDNHTNDDQVRGIKNVKQNEEKQMPFGKGNGENQST